MEMVRKGNKVVVVVVFILIGGKHACVVSNANDTQYSLHHVLGEAIRVCLVLVTLVSSTSATRACKVAPNKNSVGAVAVGQTLRPVLYIAVT
jgi:hypothetical protein